MVSLIRYAAKVTPDLYQYFKFVQMQEQSVLV